MNANFTMATESISKLRTWKDLILSLKTFFARLRSGHYFMIS